MLVVTVLAVLGGAAAAAAGTLYVANNGVDEIGCGRPADPCRTISRAIANASAGDRIIVGPGRYGDLDGDGAFEPALGEEEPADLPGCVCMIKIDKRLTIESSAGAGATILDPGPSPARALLVLADGVVFGRSGKGFTVVGRVLRFDPGTTGARIEDNTITGAVEGALVQGTGHTIIGNTFANNGHGLVVFGDGHEVTGNIFRANDGIGLIVNGSAHAITRNVMADNLSSGLSVRGFESSVEGNFIVGNGRGVVLGSASSGIVERNAVVGNSHDGILVSGGTGGPSVAVIRRNNIYGNDAVGANCGLLNLTGGPLDVSNNFWGTAGGPGPDPADTACDTVAGSTTATDPVATRPFVINVPAAH
jgi:hypothetical protein